MPQLLAGITMKVTACSLCHPPFAVRWQVAQLANVHPLSQTNGLKCAGSADAAVDQSIADLACFHIIEALDEADDS